MRPKDGSDLRVLVSLQLLRQNAAQAGVKAKLDAAEATLHDAETTAAKLQEPEPEPDGPSMAGSLAALRFMGKARLKVAAKRDAKAEAEAELRTAGKAAVITLEQQVSIATGQLLEVHESSDIHHVFSALKFARALSQKHRISSLSDEVNRLEVVIRERDEHAAFKLEAREDPVLLREIRRLWSLMVETSDKKASHQGVGKDAYIRLHICIDKAVSERGWDLAEATKVAHEDWVDDVARFSADAGITAWFTKVKGVVQNKSQAIVNKHGWRTVFETFDDDGGGDLDITEFRGAMRKFGITEEDADDDDLNTLFKEADKDGGGSLDGEEFGAWLSSLEKRKAHYEKAGLQMDKRTRVVLDLIDGIKDTFATQVNDLGWTHLFHQFDDDESGELDMDEFVHAIREECGVRVEEVGDPELKEVFAIIDVDGGGTLSADEFVSAMRTKELETDGYRMTFEKFSMSIFELVDYWTTQASQAAYLQFLRGMFRAVAAVEKHVKGRGEKRWHEVVFDDLFDRMNYKLKDPKNIHR